MPRSLSGAATVSASTGEKRWPGCGRAVVHRPGSPDRHPSRRPLAEPAQPAGGFHVAADSYDVFFDWQWQTGAAPARSLKIGRAQAHGTGLRRYVWLGQGPFALTAPAGS